MQTKCINVDPTKLGRPKMTACTVRFTTDVVVSLREWSKPSKNEDKERKERTALVSLSTGVEYFAYVSQEARRYGALAAGDPLCLFVPMGGSIEEVRLTLDGALASRTRIAFKDEDEDPYIDYRLWGGIEFDHTVLAPTALTHGAAK